MPGLQLDAAGAQQLPVLPPSTLAPQMSRAQQPPSAPTLQLAPYVGQPLLQRASPSNGPVERCTDGAALHEVEALR
jgi:hypothetical protein